MHPSRGFRWEERDEIREFVSALGFGTLFAATPDGPRVAHVPVVWLGEDALGFHVSRGNGIARHLDGTTGLFTAFGPDGYISPDWYRAGPNEVPTWNYVAVELEGTLRRMERDELHAQIEALSHANEAKLAPKPEWTSAKMDALRYEQLLGAITGFRLDIQAWRGTRKLGQNKPAEQRLAAADELDALGRRALAHWMRNA